MTGSFTKICCRRNVGTLKTNASLHLSSFEEYLAKINSYTSLKAQSFSQEERIGGWTIFSHTLSASLPFYNQKDSKTGLWMIISCFISQHDDDYINCGSFKIKNEQRDCIDADACGHATICIILILNINHFCIKNQSRVNSNFFEHHFS